MVSKIIYKVSFVIIILFAISGSMFFYTIAHELSHRSDFENYVTDEGEMCFLAYPVNATLKEIVFGDYAAGYYMYNYKVPVLQNIQVAKIFVQ